MSLIFVLASAKSFFEFFVSDLIDSSADPSLTFPTWSPWANLAAFVGKKYVRSPPKLSNDLLLLLMNTL